MADAETLGDPLVEAAEDENPPGPGLAFEVLADGEVPLDDKEEFYFRQCHPDFVTNGVPTSQMFGDFPRDAGKLSGARSQITTPKASFDFHTSDLANASSGTWAVTVAEVMKASSRVVDDTEAPSVRPPDPVPPGHAYIDMRHLKPRERKRLRGELRIAAVNRGRVHPDETGLLDFGIESVAVETQDSSDN